jgi:hypothetical protein
VRSLNTGEKPWEKYRVWLVRWISKAGATCLALGQQRLDLGPRLALRRVAEQVHDDGALVDGLLDLKQVLSRDPAVLDGVLPRLAILADADDDVETIVAQVKTLAVALRAVANEGKSVVLEVGLRALVELLDRFATYVELVSGPVGAFCAVRPRLLTQ